MSVLIHGMEMPKNCVECEWRDAEAEGECELMICNPFKTYAEQYAHCPFQMVAKRHHCIPVPEHGRLIDADALEEYFANDPSCLTIFDAIKKLQGMPVIIQADKEEQT